MNYPTKQPIQKSSITSLSLIAFLGLSAVPAIAAEITNSGESTTQSSSTTSIETNAANGFLIELEKKKKTAADSLFELGNYYGIGMKATIEDYGIYMSCSNKAKNGNKEAITKFENLRKKYPIIDYNTMIQFTGEDVRFRNLTQAQVYFKMAGELGHENGLEAALALSQRGFK